MAQLSKNNPAARQKGATKPKCCDAEMTAVKVIYRSAGRASGMYWVCSKCDNRQPTRK